MTKILIVDNEKADVDGLIKLLEHIESVSSHQEERKPQKVDYVSSAREGLRHLYKGIKKTPYDVLITDFHLGDPNEVDIDGDDFLYLIDGSLEKVISKNGTQESLIKSAASFENIRKIKGVNVEIVGVLAEIFKGLNEYKQFTNILPETGLIRVIFSGKYDGRYPKSAVDYCFQKDPNNGYCEKAIVDALVEEGILNGEISEKVSNDSLFMDEHFFGEKNGLVENDLYRRSIENTLAQMRRLDLHRMNEALRNGSLDDLD